ncbi:GNAT family N-acetyltransferase [Limnohabitans sp. JirII-31]|uniref:GNAT family N-acetyltransferase n=1 Tax=Limnohabitans sp. JirII-31 TaxID=1977908 RepID=UPI000C1F13A7|nr:GNAT family N-acetyltransferase [Limnohabitans sp. JirII-31]PIT80815.1 GNAT family N-acetyltransferase [Limnohabitans sp. JirII-31]
MEIGTQSTENRAKQRSDYVIRVFDNPLEIAQQDWDALCAQQDTPSPFMQHAYLAALHTSGSATPDTGWHPQFITLWLDGNLVAGCALYLKDHSYGEYVFDWAWAKAYADHGLNYYPKALAAVPFTPVPGSRLLASDALARLALLKACVALCQSQHLSSLHLLFTSPADRTACGSQGLLQRQTVQFHWHNLGFANFDAFLTSLNQEKRKKIKQERRRVADAGVTFRSLQGADIQTQDWDFFYQCYERTYLEHGNAPYLSREFFASMQRDMPDNWLLFIAEREQRPIASSLIALQGLGTPEAVAYGRYWGALERVDCLHFEACYYQPLNWCIDHGVGRFEGGAQGEHKMARALMPVTTYSAHWLAHPAFSDAVARFLERETAGVDGYMEHLAERSPYRSA